MQSLQYTLLHTYLYINILNYSTIYQLYIITQANTNNIANTPGTQYHSPPQVIGGPNRQQSWTNGTTGQNMNKPISPSCGEDCEF